MNFVIHGTFLEADIWEELLYYAAAPQKPEITECNSIQTLLAMLDLKHISLLVVTVDGVAGLDAVRQIRHRQPEVPLLWISDEDFSLLGYQYHVTHFLRKPVCDNDLRKAVEQCIRLEVEKLEIERLEV